MKDNRTDWNLVRQAQISILWLYASANSSDNSVRKALANFRSQNENCEVINPGILLAYAYIAFVYPHETAFKKVSMARLDCSKFTLKAGKQKDIIDRLRNSIAHGRYSISPDAVITFKDNNSCGNNPFEVEVSCGDFGAFVNSFCDIATSTRNKAESNKSM